MKLSKIKKKELIRFLFGGGSGVVVDYIIYQLLMLLGLDQDMTMTYFTTSWMLRR